MAAKDIEARLAELEAYVARNDARITQLEGWGRQVTTDLAADLQAVQEASRRAKWLRTLKR